MSYTPINWQTGDTITAEKLNKMDNGWGVQETQLFSETVTTVNQDDFNDGHLTYDSLITADILTIIINGTEYVCNNISNDSSEWNYGAPYNDETGTIDFSTYPFVLSSFQNAQSTITNILTTQAAGTYAIAVSTPTIEVSAGFKAAVENAVDSAFGTQAFPFRLVNGTTTVDEFDAATSAGRIIYYKTGLSETLLSYRTYFLDGRSIQGDLLFTPELTGYVAKFINGIFTVAESQ